MERKKLRELGTSLGRLPVGEKNCITDVLGVKVGHETLAYPGENGEDVCTGVTAILPHGGNLFQEKVAAAGFVLNGFGKTTGLVQVNELGRLESPIMLTNTLAVPAVSQGTLQYLLAENPDIAETAGTVNVVVGECNDSYLNAMRTFPVTPEHALKALHNASECQVQEGAIGAGTGMICYQYKGGIGCSSRKVSADCASYVVGCLVLSNFGLRDDVLQHKIFSESLQQQAASDVIEDGSIMIVLATDAPLNERQLKRLAKRAAAGLGRAGSHIANGSGDIVIAFSTAQTFPHSVKSSKETVVQLRDGHPIMNDLFTGASEATEEAIFNSLTMARTTIGRKGREVKALPYDILSL